MCLPLLLRSGVPLEWPAVSSPPLTWSVLTSWDLSDMPLEWHALSKETKRYTGNGVLRGHADAFKGLLHMHAAIGHLNALTGKERNGSLSCIRLNAFIGLLLGPEGQIPVDWKKKTR
eukprot:1157108-Pelagomonas_calceolata.AAC.13